MKTILNISEVKILGKKEQRAIRGGGFGPCSQTSDCGAADCWVCVQPIGRCLLLFSCPDY
ncbi:hypothetical protein [uncultured Kordia sp.]|uniref:hypothetical protein n=1 Tax=uncultured Kordia sp. TaxID=507699 RepID=UPI0026156CBF|nr:hypothetical protein [uncultured Kordia sp.]